MTEYTKPALPKPDSGLGVHLSTYSSEAMDAHADACVEAYKAHVRAEQGEPVAWERLVRNDFERRMKGEGHGPSALSRLHSGIYLSPVVNREWDAEKRKYAAPAQPVSGAADPVGQPAGEQTGPVSAAPTLTLSDEQIAAIERECYVNGALPFETRNRFARAILAAAQEKQP
jgi:hypothetical protein